jgi:hypothetical protein
MRLFFLVGAVLVGAAVGGSARAAAAPEKQTLYAVATTAQFMNHADDRLRGMSTNPFNVTAKGIVIVTKGKEKGNGPFPGDNILYSFKLYGDPKLEARAGRAMFTCYYTRVKRATCDSYFELNGGVVLASGAVAFNGTRFMLSVSGGTGRYVGALGDVRASPAARNAERLELRLLGSR